jgi:hypothetical protein
MTRIKKIYTDLILFVLISTISVIRVSIRLGPTLGGQRGKLTGKPHREFRVNSHFAVALCNGEAYLFLPEEGFFC